LIVNEKINVDRKLLKRIRAMLHDLSKNGIEEATRKHYGIIGIVNASRKDEFKNSLRGYVDFVGQIRGKTDIVYIRFKNLFEKVNTVLTIG